MNNASGPPLWTYGGKAPSMIHSAHPIYTAEALRIRLTGHVTLAFEIGIDGIAHNISVIHGLGAGLDEQAVDCLRQWAFRPALDRKGNPVPAPATIQLGFSLPNSK